MVAASRLRHAPFKTTMLNITELPVVVITTITTTAVVVAHPNALVLLRESAVSRPAHPRPINLGATKTPTIEVLVITAGAVPPRMAIHHVPPSRSPPKLRLHLLLLRLTSIPPLSYFHPLPPLHLSHPTPCILRVNAALTPLVKTTSTIQCYLGLTKSHLHHCSHNRVTYTTPVVYYNHCFLNQAASQLYSVSLRTLFSSFSLSEHDSDEPLAPPPLGKAESSGDEDRAFKDNEGSFYHPTVQHMQPLVA
ncbi:hypothetical protein DYB37_007124 [Aphanomyces astaci]|uniref:Uncharacterized protein n=1 Tax=Aphanomyces astaci TaxID=112090 RepID=A0A3R6XXF0_APHAT|nr:hypothetical protein DYB35_006157 [Aphanomyces astaci]RHZ27756.1 hypothetical protein DYB37_007124 [Aphanomyces astaci]